MQCTLLIPYLIWPRETADAVLRGLELPALTTLLARAQAERSAPLSLEAWLCQAFEVERQQDWPVAPLTAALDGAELGSAYWLRADPIHIKVERDRLLLVDSALFDITRDEAQIFTGLLNAHFAAQGVVFQALAPKRWYVSVPQAPQLATHNPDEVAGKEIQRYLPGGADAMRWHGLFNEAQMLLHEHAANEAREARGDAVVNSIWFWGGGTRPRVPGRHFGAIWSDDSLAQALAAAADVPAHSVPAHAGAWLGAAHAHEAPHLIVLNDLSNAMRYGDSEAWRVRAGALEAKWLAPLADALRHGRLARLVVMSIGATGSWRFEIARRGLMKFWRAPKPLSAYA